MVDQRCRGRDEGGRVSGERRRDLVPVLPWDGSEREGRKLGERNRAEGREGVQVEGHVARERDTEKR